MHTEDNFMVINNSSVLRRYLMISALGCGLLIILVVVCGIVALLCRDNIFRDYGEINSYVYVVRSSDAKTLYTIKYGSYAKDATFSPDGKLLAIACNNGEIRLIRTTTWKDVRVIQGTPAQWHAIWFSPKGDTLTSITGTGEIPSYRNARLFSIPDGHELDTLKNVINNSKSTGSLGDDKGDLSITASPDNKIIALNNKDNIIKFVRVSDGAIIRSLTGSKSYITDMTFSNDGSILAVSYGGTAPVDVWRVRDGHLLYKLRTDLDCVSVRFLPDGKTFATLGQDEPGIAFWRISDGRLLEKLDGGIPARFSGTGKLMAFTNSRGLAIWNIPEKIMVKQLNKGSSSMTSMAPLGFLSDKLLLVQQYNTVIGLDVPDCSRRFSLENRKLMGISPDGEFLVLSDPPSHF